MGSAFFSRFFVGSGLFFWRFSLLVLSLHSRGGFEDIPCSFEDLLSGDRPHLVHRVLLVRDRAKNVHLLWLLEDDLLDMGTPVWLHLENHGARHDICGSLGCANGSCF